MTTTDDGRPTTVVHRRPSVVGVICGLTAAAIWGGMYVVSDVVLQPTGPYPPFTLLSLRLILGLASLTVLAALVTRHPSTPLPPRTSAPLLLLTGFVGYGLSLGFQFWGTSLSTAANGALITSAAPAFIALFAYWLLREKLTLARLIALALATLGVIVVVFDPESIRLGADTLWGNFGLLGAAITWGLYSVLVKKATTQGIPTLTVTVMAPAGGLVVALPLMLWELTLGGESWERIASATATTPGHIAGILFLGVICTALAVYLWNKAFELLDATVASLLFFAQPIVGAILSAWLLHETLGLQFFLGGAMILAGVLVVTVRGKQ